MFENMVEKLAKPPPVRYFWLSFFAMVAFGIINVLFGYLNYAERYEMRKEQRMTRQMLDARARIQIVMIGALTEGRALNKDELTMINRLWESAEYTYVK